MKILILKGGFSPEREISLVTGSNIENAIKNIGYEVVSLDIKSVSCINKIINFNFDDIDCVYIALHGQFGEDGGVQNLLDYLKIPYTNSGALASSIAINKDFTKKICNALNIRVPYGFVTNKEYIIHNKILMNKKYIVKPLKSGSSINVFVFDNEHNFSIDHYPFDGDVLVEEYIHGYELTTVNLFGESIGTVNVVDNSNALNAKGNIYDYNNKYFDSNIEHIFPANINSEIYNMTLDQTRILYEFLECKGMIRIDFRYDYENNLLYMLELNTSPGMTKTSFVPEVALKAKGITFDDLIRDNIMYSIENFAV